MTYEQIILKQNEIIRTLGVQSTIDVTKEIYKRTLFLMNIARAANAQGFVLGISGGQDSFVAGALAQKAASTMGGIFVAMRLPYGIQKDEDDATKAIEVIAPHEVITYNIKDEVDAMGAQYAKATGDTLSDFLKGNDKARARMLAQYRIAGAKRLLVIGTDHAAEAITGFYTKFGDGACDVTPLSTLNKRQGTALAMALHVPPSIIEKPPTADLLDSVPQQSDETELGLSYELIDNFLEGKYIGEEQSIKLIQRYDLTQHKRDSIYSI